MRNISEKEDKTIVPLTLAPNILSAIIDTMTFSTDHIICEIFEYICGFKSNLCRMSKCYHCVQYQEDGV